MEDVRLFAASLADLLEKRRLAIFCGAGISKPSGLPLASELTAFIFEWLRLSPEERLAISSAKLPFERVMELVLAELPDRSEFLRAFERGEPSNFHHFVAGLCRKRLLHVLTTTNFDLLIERACSARGLRESVHYDVGAEFHQLRSIGIAGRWRKLVRRVTSRRRMKILKLHGSVDRPGSVATELSMVGSGLLTVARRTALQYVFETGPHTHVLVIGYSCSDFFDVTPVLQSLGGGTKTVLFVQHREAARTAGDCADGSLEPWPCPPPFDNYANWRGVRTDAMGLISALAALTGVEYELRGAGTPFDWKGAFSRWLRATDASGRDAADLAASMLLAAAALHGPARARMHAGLGAIPDSDYRRRIHCHLHIAHLEIRHGGDLAAGRRHLRDASALLERHPDRHQQMSLLGEEAELAGLRGDYAESRARLARKIELGEDDLERAGAEYALAILCRRSADFEASEQHFRRAIALFDAAGDLVDKASALGDLGNVYTDTGRLADAESSFRDALDLNRKVGDRRGEGVRLANLSTLAVRRGEFDRGLDMIRASIAIAEEGGDVAALASRVGNLAMVYYTTRQLDLALDEFQKALALAQRVGNVDREARWRANIGITLARLGRASEAVRHLQDAETLLVNTLSAAHPRVRWLRECLLLARSEAISQLAGDQESGLYALQSGVVTRATWDQLAP